MLVDVLCICGLYNVVNVLVVFVFVCVIDLLVVLLLYVLCEYCGEVYCVEVIVMIDDVDYVDDSKGMNVGVMVVVFDGFV